MLVQTQHRFSVKDYYRMAETGVLPPDARVELLNGRIIDMSPIGPFHGGVVNRLDRFFNLKANGRWIVSTQNALHLDEFSEPQPDLMLLEPRADDYVTSHPRAEDVILLIEVSDSTIEYDREQKTPDYARAGVREVWIIDLVEQGIEIYREPGLNGYVEKFVLKAGEQVSPEAFPDAVLDLGALLKR
jgi:Uma2 family endonuclease